LIHEILGLFNVTNLRLNSGQVLSTRQPGIVDLARY